MALVLATTPWLTPVLDDFAKGVKDAGISWRRSCSPHSDLLKLPQMAELDRWLDKGLNPEVNRILASRTRRSELNSQLREPPENHRRGRLTVLHDRSNVCRNLTFGTWQQPNEILLARFANPYWRDTR